VHHFGCGHGTHSTKRFHIARDVLESHLGGPIVLHKIVMVMPGYDESNIIERDDKHKTASYKFLAYLYLKNANKDKYGSLLDGLNTQQSLNNNQYLATITDANNVLSNHHFDNNKSNKTKKTDKKLKSENNVKKDEQEVPLSFAQLKGKCYCCGKPGHRLPQCCKKDLKPCEEWFIHKAKSHMQASGNANAASEGSNKSNDTESNQGTLTRRVRWARVHMRDLQFYQADAIHKCILLDSCSSTTIWSNPDAHGFQYS
jgi:hypothetical protein